MVTPKQSDPQFKLRLPAELKDRLEDAARGNNRSLNGEIVHRLEASFEMQDIEFDERLKEVVSDAVVEAYFALMETGWLKFPARGVDTSGPAGERLDFPTKKKL